GGRPRRRSLRRGRSDAAASTPSHLSAHAHYSRHRERRRHGGRHLCARHHGDAWSVACDWFDLLWLESGALRVDVRDAAERLAVYRDVYPHSAAAGATDVVFPCGCVDRNRERCRHWGRDLYTRRHGDAWSVACGWFNLLWLESGALRVDVRDAAERL